METLIGSLLLAGVVTSATLVAIGVVWGWMRTGSLGFSDVLAPEPVARIARDEIVAALRDGLTPQRLVTLGLVLLLATPFLRVAVSVVYFAATRDVKYAVFTLVVLGVLSYALVVR